MGCLQSVRKCKLYNKFTIYTFFYTKINVNAGIFYISKMSAYYQYLLFNQNCMKVSDEDIIIQLYYFIHGSYLHVIDVAARGLQSVPRGFKHFYGLRVSDLPKHIVCGVHSLTRGEQGSIWIGRLEIHGVQLRWHILLKIFPILLLVNY